MEPVSRRTARARLSWEIFWVVVLPLSLSSLEEDWESDNDRPVMVTIRFLYTPFWLVWTGRVSRSPSYLAGSTPPNRMVP